MRCSVLADILQAAGHHIIFMIDETLEGHMGDWLRDKGFEVTSPDLSYCPDNTDWMIVDHYGIDAEWERQAKKKARKIMVIDDMANREHDCDLLLDQNFYTHMDRRYDHLVPENCIILCGPSYALLRPEFLELRAKNLEPRKAPIKHLFINFGGTDIKGYTIRALEMLKGADYTIDVVTGIPNPDLKALCETHPNWQYHENIFNMGELMLLADAAIGAGGSSSWEKTCLGLPSVTVCLADNQRELCEHSGKAGYFIYLGEGLEALNGLTEALQTLEEQLETISRRGMDLVDGKGAAKVATYVQHDFTLHPVTAADRDLLFHWRNQDHIRMQMRSPDLIPYDGHCGWFEKMLGDNSKRFYVFAVNGKPAGILNVVNIHDGQAEWGFYLGEDNLPKGAGHILCHLGLQTARRDLKLQTITAEVKKNNRASLRLHKNLGFEETGEEGDYVLFARCLSACR